MSRENSSSEFERFVRDVEPRLRRALVATYGPQEGRDATAAALAWAWEHWSRMQEISGPLSYLYRVGQSSLRTRRRPPSEALVDPSAGHEPVVEPGLDAALLGLSESQRVCVMLVHGFEWRVVEVAGLLGVSESTVRNHLARAMASLRRSLEVESDA